MEFHATSSWHTNEPSHFKLSRGQRRPTLYKLSQGVQMGSPISVSSLRDSDDIISGPDASGAGSLIIH